MEVRQSKLIIETRKGTSSQLWKWNAEQRLENKEFGVNWEFGGKRLARENHFITEEATGKVLDIRGGSSASGTEVLLYTKHGQSNQRWYFEQEDRHFLVVSQSRDKNNLVLDVAGGRKGGKLLGWTAASTDNQLWQMDRMGHLICKKALVADIRGGNKDHGTDVIGFDKHEGNNQLWTFEDGQLKSNMNLLVMELNSKQEVKMAKPSSNPNQTWTFVPNNLLPDFKFMEENKNPLLEASFYKNVYDNYFWATCGFTSIYELKRAVEGALNMIRKSADQLDKVAVDTGITGAVGGGATIASSAMFLTGLCLAPVTGGLSLGLSVGSAAVGVAGAATSITGSLINQSWEKGEGKKSGEEFTKVRSGILRLQSFLNTYIKKLTAAAAFLKTEDGERLAREAFKVADAYTAAEITVNTANIGWNAYKFGNTVVKTKDIAKTIKEAKAVVDFIQADYYAVKGLKTGLAIATTRPGIKIPFMAKPLVAAGTKTAASLSVVFNVFGLAFGIWEVVGSADKIKNGSDLAKEIREKADKIQGTLKNLMDLDHELQS